MAEVAEIAGLTELPERTIEEARAWFDGQLASGLLERLAASAHETDPFEFPSAFALTLSTEYLRFMSLAIHDPTSAHVPSEFVDAIWHLHLEDPSYQSDVGAVRHNGGFGKLPQDTELFETAWKTTCAKIEQCFPGSISRVLYQTGAFCSDGGGGGED